MDIAKGVTLNYEGGAIVLKAEVAGLALPVLQDVKKKVESGEIDPVKGTDLDQVVIVKTLDAIIASLQG